MYYYYCFAHTFIGASSDGPKASNSEDEDDSRLPPELGEDSAVQVASGNGFPMDQDQEDTSETIMWEGSQMDDADAVNEWMSTTGTSPLKVQVLLSEPVQRFKLWQHSGVYDLGEVNMAGKTKEEIWVTLQSRNMLLRRQEEYKLFVKQDEVQWSDLPALDATLVPTDIPVVNRGIDFKIVDRNRVNGLREVGPLTRMTYHIFTMEGTPHVEPEVIYAPNEITSAQLVKFFILPSGINLDVGSVFHWSLRAIDPAPGEDKTKRQMEQIPTKIPPGFCLRVKCNTLRDAVLKKMVHVKYGGLRMNFAMQPTETLGRLKARVAEWMIQGGQGPGWTLDGQDDEAITFEREYEVIPPVRESPVKIYLKQAELEVMPSLSWINLSDQLVNKWKLVKGTLLRIFLVDGRVENRDNDDHSYNFEWTEG
jgi:hypothetical protein